MDRKSVLDSLAATGEERILLANAAERMLAAGQRNIPAVTDFLTGREQALLSRAAEMLGISGTFFFGGAEGAERRVMCCLPDYLDAETYFQGEDSPIRYLRIEIHGNETLTHRDYLGSILGQGIRREKIGDLFVSEHSCDLPVFAELARFLSDNLTTVGRVRVTTREISAGELLVPAQKFEEIHATVSALRLDSILSSGFRLSRSRAQELIHGGKVQLNHLEETKSDRMLSQGDLISARGLGKIRLEAVGGRTKKDRISVTIKRFV